MLEARRLAKRFHGVTVVKDVSFIVSPGEVVGYLGANGSGKTTTIRMLTGLEEPSGGAALFNGRDIADDPVAYRRHLGYVPEEPHLYPFLSGREYLELVGCLRNFDRRRLDSRIRALIELFGLTGAAEQATALYSKGMRQKILLIAALLHDPSVLILDEPESGLDVTAILILRHLLTVLAARGKAILYSSHVLEAVEKVCTKVLVLQAGRVIAEGTPGALQTSEQATLEQVFSRLAIHDPKQTAQEIADVIAEHA
jgi:ABC-2 type transport system ATP-binding protein